MSRLSKEPYDCIASTSQEGHEEAVPNLSSTRTLRVTLLSSEWKSTKGGVSTINRELAIQLAKQPNVQVTVYLPECSEDDRQVAANHNVQLIGAEKLHGLEPDLWLSCLPHHHAADCVIGHGVDLGRQVQLIQHQRHCKWIQVVHTDPEELGMFKSNADAIPKGEKQHQLEVKLCELSDQIVAVGPKLADAFSGYLRPFGKDQNVLNLTPGIFSEFAGVKQASEERRTFSVLVLGHGNSEDLQLKGYDIAAKAIAELKDNSQPYKLKVVGAPSGKEKQVAEMFLQQGIDRSQLVVRGFKEREQLAAQFCEVDLAIMPSRSEGFGLAALEALSAGLPVLVSGNSGLGEALKNVLYGTNCVVDSELPSDWAKAIRNIRQKRRDLRLKETKSICEEYANTYSWEEQCGLLVQRMRNLATGFPGGTTPASVIEHSQAALSTTYEANRRSGTGGFPFGSQFLVAPYSQPPFPGAASQAHHRSGCEGCSGGIQSSVTYHSPLPFPDSSHTQLRSAPECFPGRTTPASVMEHNQAGLPTTSEANRRSGTEGFSQGRPRPEENAKRLLSSGETQPSKRTRQVMIDNHEQGFSGEGHGFVAEHFHQAFFPAAAQAHPSSGSEGFSVGSQSLVTPYSQLSFPGTSQGNQRSGLEGFSNESQFSVPQYHHPAFPVASQAHLRSQSDGFSGGGQSSVTHHRPLTFPESSHTQLRSASEGFSVGSQSLVAPYSQLPFPGASQVHHRSGGEGFSDGGQSSLTYHSPLPFLDSSHTQLRSAPEGFPGGTTSASPMEHSQTGLPTASEANRRSGTEGHFSGSISSSVQSTHFALNAKDSQSHQRHFVGGFSQGRPHPEENAKRILYSSETQPSKRTRQVMIDNHEQGVSGGSHPLVAEHYHQTFPVATQAYPRSGAEGFSGGVSSVTHHSLLPFLESSHTQLRSAPEGFSVRNQSSVAPYSQLPFLGASQAHHRSGSEGFSGGIESSVTYHSPLPSPNSLHTQLRSAPEDFSGGGQSSATHHSLHRFPDSSHTQLRGAPEGFSIGSQLSLAQHHYPAFPAPSQGHVRSQSDGLSVGSQSSVAQYSHSPFPGASQGNLRSGSQGFPVGNHCTSTEHHHSVFPGTSQGHLRSGTVGAFGYGYIPSSIALSPGFSNVVSCLKDAYRRRSLLKPLLWENTLKLLIEDVFTRLKIVSRRKTDFRLERNEVDMYGVFLAPDDVSVLVEGSPGIGKTTFCLKIAYDWANGKIPKESSFPEFNIVLLLKCRDMNGDVIDAINDQLLPEGEKIRKELLDYIEEFHFQRNVLIILDGLDELPEMCKDNVDKLLHKKCFPFCYVLATSRQERGIKVRQDIDFDVLLQIEGFTAADAFGYIRKHFNHLGPEHSSKGERLIKAIQKNSFLHALPSNPLNLLLLCVVFEDYEGELPTRRTELYQIIVRCLLRRFCAKHGMQIPKDDKALEEQFEKSLLALGELAWTCLLEGRLSFCEKELERFEGEHEDLFARILGLVFKEASLKRINPQDEYHFFHKTFQEYLAAAYLALYLLRKKGNVFRDFKLRFHNHVDVKYRQVFLFLSGILGNEASILFRQIGEELKVRNWDWVNCKATEKDFFIESFRESGHFEQAAVALCSIVPFPRNLELEFNGRYPTQEFYRFVDNCHSVSQLQLPVRLTVSYVPMTITLFSSSFTFSLKPNWPSIPFRLEYIVDSTFAASNNLASVMFETLEDRTNVLETGFSACTPLESVVLKMSGSVSQYAILALKGVLVNTDLTSCVIVIYGDIQDSLATAIGEGLAIQTVLKSFSLTVYGRISQSGVKSLERGSLQNCSLLSLEVRVFGEIPESWATVVKSIISENKPNRSCSFHPDIRGSNESTKLGCPSPTVAQTSFNQEKVLKLWDELRCVRSEAPRKPLMDSTSTRLTLNVHGNIADNLVSCLPSYLTSPHKTLPLVTLNIWGELSRDGKIALEELKSNSHGSCYFRVNMYELMPNYHPDWLDFFLDNPSSLPPVSTKLKDCSTNKLAVTVSDMSEECARGLGDCLRNNTALTALALTINNYTGECGCQLQCLGDNLAKIKSLTLTVNYSSKVCENSGAELPLLKDVLFKSTSLTTLSLMINNHGSEGGEWIQSLSEGLKNTASLATLSLAIYDLIGNWMESLGDSLAINTSLTSLTLTVHKYRGTFITRLNGLGGGLANNIPLTSFSFTVDVPVTFNDLTFILVNGLKRGKLLTTVSLTVKHFEDSCLPFLSERKKETKVSLKTLAITFDYFHRSSRGSYFQLGEILATFLLLDTLSITMNSHNAFSLKWFVALGKNLVKCLSLNKLSLTHNSYLDTYEFGYKEEVGDCLEGKLPLKMFTLIINNYGVERGNWIKHLIEVLAKHTSFTAFTLSFNNYGDMKNWMNGLGEALAKSESLTTISVTINSCSEVCEDQLLELCNNLAKIDTLTTLSLTVNDHSDASRGVGLDLGKCFAHCKSLETLSLTVSSYERSSDC